MTEDSDKDKRIEELEELLQQHRTATQEVLQEGLSRIQQLQSALNKANEVAQAAVKERDDLSAYNKRLISTYSTTKALSDGATRTIQKHRTEIGQLKKTLAEKEAALVEVKMINLELREAAVHRLEELNELKRERAENPTNDTELLQLYLQQRQLFDLMTSTATCAMCFEPIPKNSAISLKCGHTFCSSCIDEWERTSVRLQLQQAGLATLSMFETQCPECRGNGSRAGRVKIYMLEELLRLIGQYDPLDYRGAKAISAVTEPGQAVQEDEEAALLLRPRTPSRYVVAAPKTALEDQDYIPAAAMEVEVGESDREYDGGCKTQ